MCNCLSAFREGKSDPGDEFSAIPGKYIIRLLLGICKTRTCLEISCPGKKQHPSEINAKRSLVMTFRAHWNILLR